MSVAQNGHSRVAGAATGDSFFVPANRLIGFTTKKKIAADTSRKLTTAFRKNP
jgi:hypothetical protein